MAQAAKPRKPVKRPRKMLVPTHLQNLPVGTYLLMDGVKDNPNGYPEPALFIDSRYHPGTTPIQAVMASSWLEAKAAFDKKLLLS